MLPEHSSTGALSPAIHPDRWLTVTLVTALHLAVGYSLWHTAQQVVTPAVAAQPLLVELLSPQPKPVPPAPPPEKIEPVTPPQPEPQPTVAPEPPQPVATPKPVVHEKPRPKPRKQRIRKSAPKPAPAREAPPQPVMEPVVAPTPPVTAAATPAAPEIRRVPVNYNADYLRNPAPAYPVLSRRLGQSGKVLLHVFVNDDGRPEKVEIKKSSGYQRLDQSALDAVRQWRFVPAREGSQAIASWVTIPIIFKLQG